MYTEPRKLFKRISGEVLFQWTPKEGATDTVLEAAVKSGCDLQKVEVQGLHFHMVEIDGVDFNHSNWNQSSLKSSRFTNCNFVNSSFNGADLRYVVFQDCNLIDCDLSKPSSIEGVQLVNCQLGNNGMTAEQLDEHIYVPMVWPTTIEQSSHIDKNKHTCEGTLFFLFICRYIDRQIDRQIDMQIMYLN